MEQRHTEEKKVLDDKLWAKTRQLAKKGKKGVDLVAALREDRDRDNV